MRYFISLIGLALLVGAGYFFVAEYVSVAHGQSGLIEAEQSLVGSSADGAQVLALVRRLKSIKLDDKIFTNPDFLALQDWSVKITPQEIGRLNPYLPVSGLAPTSSSTKITSPRI